MNHEMNTFSLSKRNQYPFIFIASISALLVGIHIILPTTKHADTYLPAVAAAAGFVYFLYSKHLQETKIFTDLFQSFNARYDELNEDLNRIASDPTTTLISAGDRQILFDYFNLCAEEYLYYKAGYIDEHVWKSWNSGMKYYAKATHIRELWIKELQQDSYYKFSSSLIQVK